MTKKDAKDKIIAALANTNGAMEASGIALHLRLVHLTEVSAGVEQARPHGTWWWWLVYLVAFISVVSVGGRSSTKIAEKVHCCSMRTRGLILSSNDERAGTGDVLYSHSL